MAAHKHAELMKRYADDTSLELQYRGAHSNDWCEVIDVPSWTACYEYRIKPSPPAKVYPETLMTTQMLMDEWVKPADLINSLAIVANASLRHAVDAEQVVPMAEVQEVARNLSKAHYADREMAIAKAVRHICYTSSQKAIGKLDLDEIIASVKS